MIPGGIIGIGDVNSDSRGSGARYNTGKVPYELLPLAVVNASGPLPPGAPGDVISLLGEWQRGSDKALLEALWAACEGPPTLPALADAARVFDYGRKKYAEWNWAKGMKWSVAMACAIRHCLAILDGEETDPESGQPHIGHVKCNLLMLLVFAQTYPEGDDRPVKWLQPVKEEAQLSLLLSQN